MKKLTAGIFTALLGLVTVNAANAAIPSTNYVDTKIGAVETAYQAADTSIRNDFVAADTALGNRITTNANAIGTLTDLTTSANGNTVAAINEVNAALDTLETTVGSGTMTVSGAAQTDVIAAINALDTKTEGIASSENLKTLENTVKTHTTQITDLQTADATNLQAAKDYADSLATNYDAAGAAATAETNAKAYADGLAGNYDTKGSAATAEAAAKAYADSLGSKYDAAGAAAAAENNAKDYADGELAKKVDKAQGADAANHVLITDGTGTVTTSATITQGQVANLTTDLAAKMTDVTALSVEGAEDGVYVLTAKIVGDETTYKWELIQRDVPEAI